MPGKFCPKCGEENPDLYKGLCFQCYKEENKFLKAPEKLNVTECRECGHLRDEIKWKKPSNELLKKMIKKKLDTDLESSEYAVDLRKDKAIIKVKGKADSEGMIDIEESKEIEFDFNKILCPICRRKNSKDHRVKIQLRRRQNHDKDKYEDINAYIIRETQKKLEKDNRALASWERDTEEGKNYYYGYREIGKEICDKVNRKFNLKVKESVTNAGYDNRGKRKARYTYCIRV